MNEKALVTDLILSKQRTRKLELLLAKKRHQTALYKMFHKQSKFFENHYIYGFFLPLSANDYPLVNRIYRQHRHVRLEFFTYDDALHKKNYFLFNADDAGAFYAFYTKYRDTFWLSDDTISYIKQTNPNVKLMKMDIDTYYKYLQSCLKSSFDYYYHQAKKEIDANQDCL